MGFSRQECWSGLPFPSPGDRSNPKIEPRAHCRQILYCLSRSPGHFCICIYIFRASQVTPANAEDSGDMGSIPGSGTSPIGVSGNPLQYSCLGNSHGQRSLVGYSPWGHTVRHDGATEHICMSAWPSQHNTLIQSYLGEFLAVQWLGFHSVTAEGPVEELRSHKLYGVPSPFAKRLIKMTNHEGKRINFLEMIFIIKKKKNIKTYGKI